MNVNVTFEGVTSPQTVVAFLETREPQNASHDPVTTCFGVFAFWGQEATGPSAGKAGVFVHGSTDLGPNAMPACGGLERAFFLSQTCERGTDGPLGDTARALVKPQDLRSCGHFNPRLGKVHALGYTGSLFWIK